MYRELDSQRILATTRTLSQRVAERFPGSGLSRVASELLAASEESESRLRQLRQPHWPVRLGVGFAIAALATVTILAVAAALTVRLAPGIDGIGELLQVLEAGINDVLFVGLAIFFLLTLEGRLKRRAALRALHELRSIAHIVDMHQLTKDPEYMLSPQMATASSPVRSMTRFELARYFDYCSEMLSLTSKLAALHAQYLNDPVVLNAVNDVESLAGQLSRKIWQKIMLLDTVAARTDGRPVPPLPTAPAP
jgi:hypothetical protein